LLLLLLLGYSGDAGDAFRNPGWDGYGMKFSTWDNDNDGCDIYNCGWIHGGGWWWACCSVCVLNQNGNAFWTAVGDSAGDVPVSHMLVKII